MFHVDSNFKKIGYIRFGSNTQYFMVDDYKKNIVLAQKANRKYNPKSTFKMLEAVSGITKREFLEFYLFLEQHDIRVDKFFTYMVKMWSQGKSETREYFASTISDLLSKNKKASEHRINMQRKKFINLEKQRQLIQTQFDFVFSNEEIDNILQEINEDLDRTRD